MRQICCLYLIEWFVQQHWKQVYCHETSQKISSDSYEQSVQDGFGNIWYRMKDRLTNKIKTNSSFYCSSNLFWCSLSLRTWKNQSDRTQDSLKHIFIHIYFSIITAESRTPVDVQLIARNPRWWNIITPSINDV
jgi:hypothetical protein